MSRLNFVRIVVAALAGIVLATLIGCSDQLESGVVYRKIHNDRYETIEWVSYVDHNGDAKSSFETVVHPEEFIIFIKNGENSRELDVSKRIYDRYSVGDTLNMKPAEITIEDISETSNNP